MLGLVLNAGPNFAIKFKQQIFPQILSYTGVSCQCNTKTYKTVQFCVDGFVFLK